MSRVGDTASQTPQRPNSRSCSLDAFERGPSLRRISVHTLPRAYESNRAFTHHDGSPMKKCQRCTKPAVLHITECMEGDAKALHLCESCAQDYLSTVPVGESAEELEDVEIESDVDEAEDFSDDTSTCESCGISFREFRKQGRLGCPQCYLMFSEELQPLLENIHGETEHIGKCPKRAPDSSQRQFELIRLRNELQAAIENEQYEAAAELRDRIASTEKSLSANEE